MEHTKFYDIVKSCINAQVRAYVFTKGGEVLPTDENNRINLRLFGEQKEHQILALRVSEFGYVIVESVVDGERENDTFTDFSVEEMWRIVGLFLPKE